MKKIPRLMAVVGCMYVCSDVDASASRHDNNVRFYDIAPESRSGITYERVPSERNAIMDVFKNRDVVPAADFVKAALNPRGTAGVIIFDADGDHDEDIYVTNGPGVANSLYVNQLNERGSLSFIDKGASSGLGALDQDSGGACYGDVDNDGDEDVLVLGVCEESRLFENSGNGTFADITSRTDFSGAKRCTSGCSMGDIDNDGLLDIVVANTYSDWTNWLPFFGTWDRNEHNQVYKNLGGNVFVDVSAESGIEETVGFRGADGFTQEHDGNATFTWAIALVDFDLDGDLDIFHTDDQANPTDSESGFVDRGFIRIFENDGTGRFTDVTTSRGTAVVGRWMGLAFGDLNCDQKMDFFATSTGDYWPGDPIRKFSSRWFLGTDNSSFKDTAYGDMWIPSAFGWGVSLLDYDNDADQDVVYHGSMDTVFSTDATNSGVFVKNDKCSANMAVDTSVRSKTDHQRRNVQGVATGDLNNDGFADVVSVGSHNVPADFALVPYERNLDSPLDNAGYFSEYTTLAGGDFVWTGKNFSNGNLSVEINSAGNRNNWLKVKLIGTADLVRRGQVNRDGIGAVLSILPERGDATMKPIVGGGNTYLSQDSRVSVFGLGRSKKADLEVLWPGGVKNRIYDVRANQAVQIPEIPCSYEGKWKSKGSYEKCVFKALTQLRGHSVISRQMERKLYDSALRAYVEHRGYGK